MDLRKELSQIKEILKDNPRGMTVTEIAKAIKMNRHSVARYMDMLVISGHVEMKTFGSSKVFYLARRLPMSAILNFSSDFIIVLNKDLEIINVNDRFLEFESIQKQDVLGKSIIHSSFPMEFNPSIIPHIKEALDGKASRIEASLRKGKEQYYFTIKFVPTVFDDTEKGVTIIFENITERKNAETALMVSEERSRAIFEHAAVGIAYLDKDGRFLRINQRYCDILGYTKEELSKLNNMELTHPDDMQATAECYGQFTSGGIHSCAMEKRFMRKDGGVVWVNLTVSCIREPDGSLRYFIPVIEDITARKKAEEALKESEERFRAIFEHAAVGIAYLSQDGRFLRINQRFCDILGYPQDELIRLTFKDITYTDDLKDSNENTSQLMSGKISSFSMEKRYIRRDGSIEWAHLTVSCIRGPDGPVKYTIAILEDISGRKKAEEALRRVHEDLETRVNERTAELKSANEALLSENERCRVMESELTRAYHMMHDIIEKAPFGIYVVTELGSIEYVNPAMLRIAGDDDREFRNMNVFELPTYRSIGLSDRIKSALGGEYFYLGPVEYTSHYGKKTSLRNFIGVPMEEGGVKKVLVFVEDISGHKNMEEKLQKNEALLRDIVDSLK
jgi:PAS domain S-box-containing protein